MRTQNRIAAFTLVELAIGAATLGAVCLMVFSFTAASSRLVSRNLTSNHGHEAIRISSAELLQELHSSGSNFQLLSFDGSKYADTSEAATSDQDPISHLYLSNRSNGVRYRRFAAGPCRLTQSTSVGSTTLEFDFTTATSYIPTTGDKVVLPLIQKEFIIKAVAAGSAPGSRKITITPAIDYALSVATGNNTTGYFYRMAAFTVWNQQLRYHPSFYSGSEETNLAIVREMVTSPKPFAAVYDSSTSSGTTDTPSLAVSLETYDSRIGVRKYLAGASTLNTVVPTRNAQNSNSAALKSVD